MFHDRDHGQRIGGAPAVPRTARPCKPDTAQRDAAVDHHVWRSVQSVVSGTFGIDVCALEGPSRGLARAARARQVAMYLAHIVAHVSLTDVGRMAGRDRTTVAHACAVIEDARDDPTFDKTLNYLERCVLLLVRRSETALHN